MVMRTRSKGQRGKEVRVPQCINELEVWLDRAIWNCKHRQDTSEKCCTSEEQTLFMTYEHVLHHAFVIHHVLQQVNA